MLDKILIYIENIVRNNPLLTATTITGMFIAVVIVESIIIKNILIGQEGWILSYGTDFIVNIFIAIINLVLYILFILLGGFLGYCVGMFPIISTAIITIAAIVAFAYYQTI